MKHPIKSTLIAVAMVSLMISGCTKTSEVIPESTTPTTATAPTITISDSYGTLAAVRSVSYTIVAGMTIPLELNTAVAAFTKQGITIN